MTAMKMVLESLASTMKANEKFSSFDRTYAQGASKSICYETRTFLMLER